MKKTDEEILVQEAPPAKRETVFTKEAILRCKRWRERRDALSFLLKDGESYSHKAVEALLSEYYAKGKVK